MQKKQLRIKQLELAHSPRLFVPNQVDSPIQKWRRIDATSAFEGLIAHIQLMTINRCRFDGSSLNLSTYVKNKKTFNNNTRSNL